MPANSCSGCFVASSKNASCPACRNSALLTCRRRWRPRSTIICPTGSAALASNTCMSRIARPGSAIRRRAGSGGARRSAACPVRFRARCCAVGTPITASRSATRTLVSSAPNRVWTVRTASRFLPGIRPFDRDRATSGVCASSRGSLVRSRRGAGLAGRAMAEAKAREGLSELRDGVRANRRTRHGAAVRP